MKSVDSDLYQYMPDRSKLTATAEFEAQRELIRHILRAEAHSPHPEKWSVQGFGMLRMYIDPEKRYRLNIWDDRLAVPNVSIIHDHPWHFKSWIISGHFRNRRYSVVSPLTTNSDHYSFATIMTGEGGGPVENPRTLWLGANYGMEHYGPGDTYSQEADEIHASFYRRGTITLNERTPIDRASHARVFWPHGTDWVDAMPRAAIVWEIDMVLKTALEEMEQFDRTLRRE